MDECDLLKLDELIPAGDSGVRLLFSRKGVVVHPLEDSWRMLSFEMIGDLLISSCEFDGLIVGDEVLELNEIECRKGDDIEGFAMNCDRKSKQKLVSVLRPIAEGCSAYFFCSWHRVRHPIHQRCAAEDQANATKQNRMAAEKEAARSGNADLCRRSRSPQSDYIRPNSVTE